MNAETPRIHLASRSPRRRELLHQVHVRFELLLFRSGERADPQVSEDLHPGEAAEEYVLRVARAKAAHGRRLAPLRALAPRLVLAADTTVELDGLILGKPADAADAHAMLRLLAGRSHRVLTAVALAEGERLGDALSVSEVRFGDLDDADIERYVASGEPFDKAGGYGIQGRAGAFVEEIRGSYSGIMGLPLYETARLLRSFGYPV